MPWTARLTLTYRTHLVLLDRYTGPAGKDSESPDAPHSRGRIDAPGLTGLQHAEEHADLVLADSL